MTINIYVWRSYLKKVFKNFPTLPVTLMIKICFFWGQYKKFIYIKLMSVSYNIWYIYDFACWSLNKTTIESCLFSLSNTKMLLNVFRAVFAKRNSSLFCETALYFAKQLSIIQFSSYSSFLKTKMHYVLCLLYYTR